MIRPIVPHGSTGGKHNGGLALLKQVSSNKEAKQRNVLSLRHHFQRPVAVCIAAHHKH